MAFVPNTDAERKEMLDQIGVNSFEELIEIIPEEVRLKDDLKMMPKLSEMEASRLLNKYANKNVTADSHACFMGGGAYDHYTPAIVGSVLERPEFKTAYTPYQAEVSQGTLQVMYEFQSMIAELTGMDVANASMYDGGSALAEACLLAHAQNKKTEVLIAGKLNPMYRAVLDTITPGRNLTYTEFVNDKGTCDIDALKAAIGDNTTAVIVQQPNFYGLIENVNEIKATLEGTKALFVVAVNPISLGLLEAPGNYGADIVVGEGQSLGLPLSFGGPYIGLFASTKKFTRKLPGRLAGITQDSDGTRGFVLTLQTREQQIKREKATSNICTNQGLCMLATTAYMETMGKQGIKEVAEQSFSRAHYLAEEIKKINGFELVFDTPFFNEFLVKTPVPASEICAAAMKEGFLAGVDMTRFDEDNDRLLIAATEKRTKEDMDGYVTFLKKFAK